MVGRQAAMRVSSSAILKTSRCSSVIDATNSRVAVKAVFERFWLARPPRCRAVDVRDGRVDALTTS